MAMSETCLCLNVFADCNISCQMQDSRQFFKSREGKIEYDCLGLYRIELDRNIKRTGRPISISLKLFLSSLLKKQSPYCQRHNEPPVFSFSGKIFDGSRLITVVLTACFD